MLRHWLISNLNQITECVFEDFIYMFKVDSPGVGWLYKEHGDISCYKWKLTIRMKYEKHEQNEKSITLLSQPTL